MILAWVISVISTFFLGYYLRTIKDTLEITKEAQQVADAFALKPAGIASRVLASKGIEQGLTAPQVEELALRKAQQEEQVRQFNEQLAESRRSSGSGGASSFSFAPTETAQPAAQKSLRETWQEEANNGDGNAQVALNYAGDDGRYDGPVNSSREFNILKSMGIQGGYYVSPKSSSSGLSVSSASLPKLVNSSGLTVRL